MTFDSALFDPRQVWLEIPAALQSEAWQRSQALATPDSQWNALLNRLCLETLLPWLQEDYGLRAQAAYRSAALPAIWEFVNGMAIDLQSDRTPANQTDRLVVIPSETIDTDELRVPQEWVDIPTWAADYYLLVQVNPDAGWVRLQGFTTHQHLKQNGRYDWRDRTYALDEADLISDINALWVARQLSAQAAAPTTQAALAPLPALSLEQANALIQRLGQADRLLPRLEVPFEQWGALLAHDGWRQRLAERRWGLPEQRSLWSWLQTGISELGQQWGWSQVAYAAGEVGARGEVSSPQMGLARALTIAGQPYEMRVVPLEPSANTWRFELVSLVPGGQIPAGFCLRLLSEDLQPFEDNEDIASTAVDRLYLDVVLSAGEGLVWETVPAPAGYEREILRF